MRHRNPIIKPCSAHDMFAKLTEMNVGRLPEQQPSDVGALARALATIGCVGGLGLVIGSAAACGLLGWLLQRLAPLL